MQLLDRAIYSAVPHHWIYIEIWLSNEAKNFHLTVWTEWWRKSIPLGRYCRVAMRARLKRWQWRSVRVGRVDMSPPWKYGRVGTGQGGTI